MSRVFITFETDRVTSDEFTEDDEETTQFDFTNSIADALEDLLTEKEMDTLEVDLSDNTTKPSK